MKKIALFLLVCFLLFSFACTKRIKEPDFIAVLEKVELAESNWVGTQIYRLEFDNGAILFFKANKVPVFKIGIEYGVYKKTDDYVWRVDENQ